MIGRTMNNVKLSVACVWVIYSYVSMVKLSVACVWVIYSYVSMVFHSKFVF